MDALSSGKYFFPMTHQINYNRFKLQLLASLPFRLNLCTNKSREQLGYHVKIRI